MKAPQEEGQRPWTHLENLQWYHFANYKANTMDIDNFDKLLQRFQWAFSGFPSNDSEAW